MKTATFYISDLSCEGCVKTIMKTFEQYPQVKHPHIDVATKILTVEFDPDVLCENHIINYVKEAGYTAKLTS